MMRTGGSMPEAAGPRVPSPTSGATSSISSNSSPRRPSPPWRRRCARSLPGAGERRRARRARWPWPSSAAAAPPARCPRRTPLPAPRPGHSPPPPGLAAALRPGHPRRGGVPAGAGDRAARPVEFRGGGIGSLLVSQVAPGRKNGLVIEIAGERESLRFAQEQPGQLWLGRRAESRLLVRDAESLSADAARLCRDPAGHPQGYQDGFDAFIADSYAVFAGEQREGVPRLADGLRAVTVTEAVLRSAAERRWVEVEQP